MSKPISIVIITNDDSTALRETLPELFSQQYDAAFEVIVVRETRTGEIKDLLEPFYERYPNLRTTYLPDKPQYVSNEEVEILLGVKAAQYEDIIIVTPSFMPTSENWLNEASAAIMNDETGLSKTCPVLFGNAHYSDRGYFFRRRHIKQVKKVLKPWRKANGIKAKTLRLPKDCRSLISIAFLRQAYLDDMPLRNIIYTHTEL